MYATHSGDHADTTLLTRPAPAMCPDEPRPFRATAIDPTTITVGGDVDVASAPALRVALADCAVTAVDLATVTFIDAAGLGVLLDAHRRRAGGLALRAPSPCVRRLLALAGHAATFPVLDR